MPPLHQAACRIRVRGVVQGVGFRPFVHRLALRHRLGGWVRNASGDVQLALEGERIEINDFLTELRLEAPPLSRIEEIAVEDVEPEGFADFVIEASAERPGGRLRVPPDVGLCPTCERELTDPMDRRYRYPFITCTDCGPRYTVIERLPYDRERTTMRAFTPCPACAAEYHSPEDRRYHSETNSCHACGPMLWYEAGAAGCISAENQGAIRDAAELLAGGGILALRGFGGFHLACDATSESAVTELRRRKRREAKPFAVMVRTLEVARAIADVDDAEAALLASRERPVVLLPAADGGGLAPSLAPGLATVGVMLPSTPVHLLLLEAVDRPLVMTSGNLSEEPIAIGNAEARRRLAVIADAFLMHDRDILSRTDDSVLRVVAGAPILHRRARGFAPLPLPLPVECPVPLLAVGAHLKNTFTVAQGSTAWVSPHIGDLENLEGLEHFRRTLVVYRRLFRVEPEAVAHDLHPGYLSTKVAHELGVSTTIAVQHHQAHIAAVMAEHGVTEPVIGVAYDGTGYGQDGAVWGGEVFAGDLTGLQRVGHLRYAPLPGGDLAVRQPWRTALGYASLCSEARTVMTPIFARLPAHEVQLAEQQIARKLNCPMASSMGRLFDAAAMILGVRHCVEYEGQAAVELECLAGQRAASEFHVALDVDEHGVAQLDPLPLLTWLARRRLHGADIADLAADFHESVAHATTLMVARAAEVAGLRTVALGGGVFQNARLLDSVRRQLQRRGFRVLVPRLLPPNDGAISYGQAAMAAAMLASV
ncbi:MAG: carbamoyltransferase HypF [Gemmatimonadales bacterium]